MATPTFDVIEPTIEEDEISPGMNNDFALSDHISMAQPTSALDAAAPGPSGNSAEKKYGFGKVPKRRNIRHVLDPHEFGSETLEERKREQERQQRVQQMTLAARLQQHQHPAFGAYSQHFSSYLSDREQTEIAARQAVWQNFKATKQERDDEDVVILSSDDEENEGKSDVKRIKKLRADSEDESDCVCLDSDEDEGPAGSSQDNEQAAASAHINDDFNVPDADGRVLINVGHSDSEPDVFLPQHLVNVIKTHQIGGLRFMYDNVVESVQKFNPNGGFGCILAHSMGLGKTFQIVSFTDIVYRHTPLKRVLLIVPVNTLQNWLHEYEMWLPRTSFQKDVPSRQFDVSVIADGCKTWGSRAAVINDWYRRSGVLIVGYEMFRMLTNKIGGLNSKKCKPNYRNGFANGQDQRSGSKKDDGEMLDLSELARALLDPGPDLVICDEGHRIKNFQSHTSKALSTIRTKRRIVLTGYPLQNNLMEYWCMVNFVRPNYLGTRQEFASVFERPIKNGQCVDSTEKDIKVMRYRVHVLTNLLKGFVQRRSHSLLSETLPAKSEYVLFLRKSPIQHRLYRRFIVECTADMREDVGSWNPLKAFAVCCKIWNHPDVLYKALKDHVDAVDGDLDLEAPGRVSPSTTNGRGMQGPECSSSSSLSNGFFQFRLKKDDKRHIDYRWAEELFENYMPGCAENGMKMQLALKIIERSVRMGDKILLFSQSLLTLNVIESFLNAMFIPGADEKWKKNRSYFRLDGSTNSIERQRFIARFNNERGVHLFLISTRAGSLGINLIGANRVIVFDASFNPCHDAQAVCRVYRYGQKKPTFIYRLIADNSMEKTIFNRQLGKQGIADRVIDERAMDAALCRQDLYDLLQYKEEDDMMTENCHIDPSKYKDELLVAVCQEHAGCLAKAPVAHESLMLDRGNQKLSDEEKREAKRGYERELKLIKQGGNGVDWKRWQTERNPKPFNFSESTTRPHRNWVDFGPPPVHPTPMPMMIQSASYPQLANGSHSMGFSHMINDVPPAPMWYQQMPYPSSATAHFVRPMAPQESSFPAPRLGNMSQLPNLNGDPPELITLSDDES